MCFYPVIPIDYPFLDVIHKAAYEFSWHHLPIKSRLGHRVWHRMLPSIVAKLLVYRTCQRLISQYRQLRYGHRPYLLHRFVAFSQIRSRHPVAYGYSWLHPRHKYRQYMWHYRIQRNCALLRYPLIRRIAYRSECPVYRYRTISLLRSKAYVGMARSVRYYGSP